MVIMRGYALHVTFAWALLCVSGALTKDVSRNIPVTQDTEYDRRGNFTPLTVDGALHREAQHFVKRITVRLATNNKRRSGLGFDDGTALLLNCLFNTSDLQLSMQFVYISLPLCVYVCEYICML